MKVQAYRPGSISKVVGKRAEAILNLKGKQQTLCKGKRSRPTVDVTGRGDYIQSSNYRTSCERGSSLSRSNDVFGIALRTISSV